MAVMKQRGRIVVVAGMLLIIACVMLIASFLMMSHLATPTSDAPQLLAQDLSHKQEASSQTLNDIDWDYWKSINADIVAWVRVPGTAIDQPVVAPPPERASFYLTHDVYGNFNLWGCPYIDSACTRGLSSNNVVVYGHNMGITDAVFHDFANFADQAYAQEHARILLFTPDVYPEAYLSLNVCGVDVIGGGQAFKRTSFSAQQDFEQYKASCLLSSKVKLRDEIEGQLFTFCTCSYSFNPFDERTLVYASA